MHKVTKKLTYYIPEGFTCGECRFCVKTKAGYTCAIYNEPLLHEGKAVRKTESCLYD